MTGDLLAAIKIFLNFAVEVEAITEQDSNERFRQCEEGILYGTSEQREHAKEQDPVVRFIQLIGMALTTKRAHLASTEDGASEPITRQGEWGWSRENLYVRDMASTVMKSSGPLIGWTDANARTVWLEPTAAYNLAYKLAVEQGMPFAVTPSTLWKRLKEAGQLADFDTEMRNGKPLERNRHSKVINGAKLRCIALHATTLKPPAK